MLLVVDIGNTNICFGFFEGERLLYDFRLKTDIARTEDEYLALTGALVAQRGFEKPVRGCLVASVVPALTSCFVSLTKKCFQVEPKIVSANLKLGMRINVNEPFAVGADRLADAVAGKQLYGASCLVVDLGTATTFNLVGKSGDFEGGAICPGIMSSADSLTRNTAQLPRVQLVWPESLLGKNTVTAMQAGCVAGYGYMIDGMIAGLVAEVGPIDHIIATGGYGQVMTTHSKFIQAYDIGLTLKGLRCIAEMNGI